MATPTQVKTWGDALDWTWNVKWRRLRSAKTIRINTGHITNYAGRSLPIKRMKNAGWWMELMSTMEDEGRSSSTINRIVSAGTTALNYTRLAGLHEVDCPKFARLKDCLLYTSPSPRD